MLWLSVSAIAFIKYRLLKYALANCRDKIQNCLEDTPSLQRFLQNPEWVEKYCRRTCRDAAKEANKSVETFPTEYP